VWSQYDAIVNGYTDELLDQYGFTVSPNVTHVEDSKNVGVFGSINYDISDSTTFSFEGRWQNEELTNKNPVTFDSFTNSTDKFLPRIAITHTIDDNVTVYAQISVGNNPAGVIPAAASPRIIASHEQATELGLINWSLDSVLLYEEEEIVNYEIGVKATLADNRVTLASTIYTMDWENYNQAFTLNWDVDPLWLQQGNDPADAPGRLPGYNPGDYRLRAQLNAGDASVYGWENEVRWQANDNWTLAGTLTWQETQYDDFCSPSAVSDIGLTPTSVISDGSGVPFNCVDVAGNSLTRQPDLKYTLSATYRAPLGNTGWQWSARADWRSIGEQYLDDMNFMSTPVTETLNGSVNFSNDDWNLRIWGRNLTDDDTPIRISEGQDYNTPLPSTFWFIPRDPSEIGVQLAYSF
jgi:outer membrane receptor protein involved in Fe transport